MANNDSGFSVMDMIDEFAADHEMDPKEIFRRNPVSGNVKAELEGQEEQQETPAPVPEKKEKKPWVPDASLTKGMSEFQAPGAVYDKDEIKFEEEPLKNNADESAIQESRESMDDMSRKTANIEEAKARHNISKLHIPPGEMQVKMLIAAGDTNHMRAQQNIDAVLEEISKVYPEWIEYAQAQDEETPNPAEFPTVSDDPAVSEEPVGPSEFGTAAVPEAPSQPVVPFTPRFTAGEENMEPGATIIIDKRNVPEISWTPEEVDKIKKSRTVELNIVEGADLKFGSIKDVDTANVDAVLAQYQRKTNDIVAALPASKYRATFTGLAYPEVIDLSSSNEMNNLDGERKKWSICFQHIKNQSIGPWEEYILYKDPETEKTIKVSVGTEIPDNVPDENIHYVSKFEDFQRKTSYMDLEFMLWKILCATAMDKEIVSIDCHSVVDGKPCGNSYDWIYNPADLLSMNTIDPAVLEEMKETGEASSTKEIMENYNTSPVRSNNFVKLHTSGFMPIYGHVSAYEYLNEIYSKIKELEDPSKVNPTIVSKAMSYTFLCVIKAVLIPDEEGNAQRITGVDSLLKVLDTLDEIDWQTIEELTRMMIAPYQFRYSMRDIVCPKCKNRSIIPIEDMSRLLFIVARSLSSVHVTLKRT